MRYAPRLRVSIIGALLCLLSGCVYVTPEWQGILDRKAANSRAYANSVKDDATVPAGVRVWIKDQAVQDTNIANWGNGRPAQTQP